MTCSYHATVRHASASTTETFYDAGAPDAPRVAETLQKFLEESEPPRT